MGFIAQDSRPPVLRSFLEVGSEVGFAVEKSEPNCGIQGDVVADSEEKTDLAAGGIPEKLKEKHSRLKTALDKRIAQTKRSDPIQNGRRKMLNRKPR